MRDLSGTLLEAEQQKASYTPYMRVYLPDASASDPWVMTQHTIRTDEENAWYYWGDGRALARKSNGDLWCVYCLSPAAGDTVIYASYSTDGGETWSHEEISAVAGEDQGCPAIAIDSQDEIHVVWAGKGHGTETNYDNIQYRKRTAGGWQSIEHITDTDIDQGPPAIAIDSQDEIHVVWDGGIHYGPPGNTYWYRDNILYRKRTASAWADVEAITDLPGYEDPPGTWEGQYSPCIAIDTNDYIHVGWNGHGLASTYPEKINIGYCQKTDSWQSVEEITDVNGDQYGPDIAVDKAGIVSLIWYGKSWGTNSSVYNTQYQRRVAGGWDSREPVSDNALTSNLAGLGLDSYNNKHVLYRVVDSPHYIAYRKRTHRWEDVETHTPTLSYMEYPKPITALFPVISSKRTNLPKTGFAIIWPESNASAALMYGASPDLTWE